MNERIKELAEQAQKVIWPADGNVTELTNLDIEKFAELIVKECAGIYEKIDNGNLHMGTDNYLEALQKHFRVEEQPVCEHEWYSAKNPVVMNGSVCVKCHAIDPREPEELKNES